jgi:NAD(P)-dependent dehydrogenase (short-subunit alcohol dehydrogenase family)
MSDGLLAWMFKVGKIRKQEEIIAMRQLDGKVAVITGGAGGIGTALAEAFGSEGMKLVLADVERNALDQAVQRLTTKGLDVVGIRCDVAKFDQVETLAQGALERFGKVHVVCNNAGVSITGPIFEMSLDDWRWVYDVNVWGVIHGIKAFVPILMRQGEEAHVINVASLASFNGTGDHAPYCSSKAAVLSLSQALYSEMRAFNAEIGVSVVCPGMVDTAINKSWRNRPKDDTPWSDREYKDEAFMQASDKFQGVGVPPQDIARVTLEALKAKRFYVFNGEGWRDYAGRFLNPILGAENPPVLTWGPDLRPDEKKKVDGRDQLP